MRAQCFFYSNSPNAAVSLFIQPNCDTKVIVQLSCVSGADHNICYSYTTLLPFASQLEDEYCLIFQLDAISKGSVHSKNLACTILFSISGAWQLYNLQTLIIFCNTIEKKIIGTLQSDQVHQAPTWRSLGRVDACSLIFRI